MATRSSIIQDYLDCVQGGKFSPPLALNCVLGFVYRKIQGEHAVHNFLRYDLMLTYKHFDFSNEEETVTSRGSNIAKRFGACFLKVPIDRTKRIKRKMENDKGWKTPISQSTASAINVHNLKYVEAQGILQRLVDDEGNKISDSKMPVTLTIGYRTCELTEKNEICLIVYDNYNTPTAPRRWLKDSKKAAVTDDEGDDNYEFPPITSARRNLLSQFANEPMDDDLGDDNYEFPPITSARRNLLSQFANEPMDDDLEDQHDFGSELFSPKNSPERELNDSKGSRKMDSSVEECKKKDDAEMVQGVEEILKSCSQSSPTTFSNDIPTASSQSLMDERLLDLPVSSGSNSNNLTDVGDGLEKMSPPKLMKRKFDKKNPKKESPTARKIMRL